MINVHTRANTPVDEHKMGTRAVAETGLRTGSERAEERRNSGRNHSRVVDAMWETGETWAEGEKDVDKKGGGFSSCWPGVSRD